MAAEAWTSWAVVAVSASVHLVVSIMLVAFPGRPVAYVTQAGLNGNGEQEESPRYLDPRARVLAIGLQAITLVSASLGIANGISPNTIDVPALIIGGGIGVIGRSVIHAGASFTAHRFREASRDASRPIVWSLTLIASLPGTAWLAELITGRRHGHEATGAETSAAIRESLDYLEDADIPADADELRMIRGILRMDTVKVREIMVPRPDVLASPLTATPAEIANQMTVGGHSKIPVYEDALDNVKGIVYARDLLNAIDRGEPDSDMIRRLARPALYVPESQSLESLLREFQEHRTGIAIVLDEYGGVCGLVTVTDLIEEIVGELVDEFDVEPPELQVISDREALADAGISIDQLNESLGCNLSADGVDTVGGLVYRELGKMPSPGDIVRVNGVAISVQSMVGRRIRRVRVVNEPPAMFTGK